MAANVAVTYNFTAGTPAVADNVDQNFADIVNWINTNAVHLDGSKTFSSIPSGPASDPTSDNQFARKAYVDAGARGTVAGGYVQITAPQGGITSTVDVTGLSITFTAVAGRRYRVHGSMYLTSSVTGDLASLQITDGSNNQLQSTQEYMAGSGKDTRADVTCIVVPGAGSKTYKIRANRASGTGTVQVTAGATFPGFLLIEDIGT